MTTLSKPAQRPANPNFSSGPCAKRPGWSLDALSDAALGRSHRAKVGKTKLKQAIDLTREILAGPRRLPHRYRTRPPTLVLSRWPFGRFLVSAASIWSHGKASVPAG